MNFIESILEQFGVKSPNLEPTFRAMLIGDDMAYFENIRSIKCFSPTRIILLIKKGEVTIEGEDLCVKKYNAGDLAICGKISLIKRD